MDQSKSSSSVVALKSSAAVSDVVLPKRKFGTEFYVGVFTLIGVACGGWLAVGLGGVEIMGSDSYEIFAEFDNISGLKNGATIEIAGVQIGQVTNIALKDPAAKVTFRINNPVKMHEDDIASIRTKGIIGDRYVKISRGASQNYITSGGTMMDTESVVDIEDIIGKLVHSLSGDKSETKDGESK